MNLQMGNGQMAEAREAYALAVKDAGKASDCIGCKQCEKACPQHLPITEHMKQAVQMFGE